MTCFTSLSVKFCFNRSWKVPPLAQECTEVKQQAVVWCHTRGTVSRLLLKPHPLKRKGNIVLIEIIQIQKLLSCLMNRIKILIWSWHCRSQSVPVILTSMFILFHRRWWWHWMSSPSSSADVEHCTSCDDIKLPGLRRGFPTILSSCWRPSL